MDTPYLRYVFILAQNALLNDVPVLIKHYRVKFQSRRN